MEDEYRYTQVGIATIIMIILAAAFTVYVIVAGLEINSEPVLLIMGIVVGLLILTLAAFYSFTIQIVFGKVKIWFGFGVGKRPIDIADIRTIEIVNTPWYYLWGIKLIPGGWLYSIAPGGRALKLVFMDNRVIHLGSDCPEEIKARLDARIGSSN